jgi:hypothetical protein
LARRRPARKVVDESIYLGRPRRGSILKEEVWVSHEGEVVKYSLALATQFQEEVWELWRREDEERESETA